LPQYKRLKNSVFFGLLVMAFGVLTGGVAVCAQEKLLSSKEDYIHCDVQPCVKIAGSIWSEQNPNGVAVAVRMGTKSAATDDQIKMVLTRDLMKHDVTNIKFFYEQNDAPASGIFLHVRGGTEGIFTIRDVRQKIPAIARRALNKNPLFQK
jgi:hypothetical protein